MSFIISGLVFETKAGRPTRSDTPYRQPKGEAKQMRGPGGMQANTKNEGGVARCHGPLANMGSGTVWRLVVAGCAVAWVTVIGIVLA